LHSPYEEDVWATVASSMSAASHVTLVSMLDRLLGLAAGPS